MTPAELDALAERLASAIADVLRPVVVDLRDHDAATCPQCSYERRLPPGRAFRLPDRIG